MGTIVLGVDVHTSYAIIMLSALHAIRTDDPDRGTTTMVLYNLHHDNGTKATNCPGEKSDEEIMVSTEVHTDGDPNASGALLDDPFSVICEKTGRTADHALGRNCHTGHSTLSVSNLHKNPKTGSDRVNGVLRNTVVLAPGVSGV